MDEHWFFCKECKEIRVLFGDVSELKCSICKTITPFGINEGGAADG